MRMKTISGMAALALLAWSGTAMADDDAPALHAFGDISLKNDYVTPRGLVVTTQGATIQALNGLVLTTPLGVTFHAGTWVDLNPGYSKADGNITAVNEVDWFVGADGNIMKNLNLGVEFSQFISGQPSVAFKRENNIEFSLKYSDNPDGKFSINPYGKFFWAFNSKSSTVVTGKAGNTFDVELGAVPTYKLKGISFSAPTWVTVGPKTYWGLGANKDGNVGVFSTGLKGAVPLSFLSSVGGKASIYGMVQYYNLINDNLVRAKGILNSGASNRDHFVFGVGINYGF